MAKTLIKTITVPANESAPVCEIDFIDGASGVVFDDTYSVYEFHFVNMHTETNQQDFAFQVNSINGAGFNDSPITSTFFDAFHNEGDSDTDLTYVVTRDLANAVDSFQPLFDKVTNADDEASVSGVLTLYDPSSTTYVKHFTSRAQGMHHSTYSADCFAAGYINDYQYAIDEIRFKFISGDINAGVIKMFGVS